MAGPYGAPEDPSMRGDIRRLHDKIDNLTHLMHDQFVTIDDLELLRSEVRELKGWQVWAIRIVLAAVILALLALVFTGKAPTS